MLLLPFFSFQVVSNKRTDFFGRDLHIVTLVEIPHQNLLNLRQINYISLIFLGPESHQLVPTLSQEFQQEFINESSIENVHVYLEESVKSVLVINETEAF